MAFLNTLKTKLLNFNKKVDDYQEAITFSEAGIQRGRDQNKLMTCVENQGRNLVVAIQNSRFPDDMVDYALEMAKRMDYDIIAVNAANLTHEVTDFFSSTHENLYREFKQVSTEKVQDFKEKSERMGLKFVHVTNFSDIDHAIKDITHECGQVEFVITENRDQARVRESAENTRRIAQRLFVYSVD
jgi:hypothetical protein